MATIHGAPARWRRMECNSPLPRNPVDFRFQGIDGRGKQELLRDPRNNRGFVVVRIEDPKGGSEGYTFDLEWGGESRTGVGGFGTGGRREPGRFWGGSRMAGEAVRNCEDLAAGRLAREGYERISIQSSDLRGDSAVGRASAQRGFDSIRFEFSCRADSGTGAVWDAQLSRR
jgi:hypothetical protein